MVRHFCNKQDESFIQLALNASKPNIGLTHFNPIVGCIVVKNDTIISIGVTNKGGTPHAEEVAIKKAADQTIGATLYVTLEPCAHFGKTPPCVDLIIKSKIARVVIATVDPDTRVNGLGIEKLKQAGIEVIVGVLEKQAQELNHGFFTTKKLSRPFITLKLAISLDGKIASKNSDSKWITSEKSRLYAHYLRAKNDAILVGANTIKADDPMLDCRIAGLEGYCPARIILSSKLNMNLNSKILQTANKIPTYIATSNPNHKEFTDLGVKIIQFGNHGQPIDLKLLTQKICQLGINNLLIEGGSVVATSFLRAQLVDQLIVMQSNKIIGEGTPALENLDINSIEKSENIIGKFDKSQVREFADDVMVNYLRDCDKNVAS